VAPRTLIVGLDGATFDLMDPWIAMGRLPTLSRVMGEGVRGHLRAFPNMNSASAWTSIVTGCNPGEHGVHDFGDDRTVYDPSWRPTSALDRRRPAFWHTLDECGQRVGVINVPISYPADPVDGFMISGMDAPGTSSSGFTHPAGLLDELRRAGIDYVLDVPNLGRLREQDSARLPDSVRRMVDARGLATSRLMDRYAPDVTMVVFTATDRVQHTYWGEGPVADDDGTWQPLATLYQQLDAWVGRLWEQVGAEANLIVLSDHGFGLHHDFPSLVNPLFAQRGWLFYRSDSGDRHGSAACSARSRARSMRNEALKWALYTGRRWLPGNVQYALAKRFPRWRQQALHARNFPDIDWARTQVYGHAFGGGIMVRPASASGGPAAYEDLCAEVRAALLELCHPATGERLIREVWRRDDLYHGPHTGRAADLQIEWNEEASAQTQAAPIAGGSWKPGKGRHRSGGVFLACGPDVRRGVQLRDSDPRGADITHYDVTPTLFHLQGLAVPADVDGRVLTGMMTSGALERRPVQIGASLPEVTSADAGAMDEADARRVERRLRDLGYL